MELKTIYHADCLEVLEQMPDTSIDAFIADPPYNLTELAFDQQPIDWARFWRVIPRKLKRPSSPVILCSQQPFTTDLIISNRRWYRTEIIYEKAMSTGYLNSKVYPLRSHENVVVFAAAAPDYFPQFEESGERRARARGGKADHYNKHERVSTWEDDGKRYPRSVWRFAQRKNAFNLTKTKHKTEKPVGLMERLILNYTLPGAVVMDGFCGSGSTLYAANCNGRDWLGCEIDAELVEEARTWLALPVGVPMF